MNFQVKSLCYLLAGVVLMSCCLSLQGPVWGQGSNEDVQPATSETSTPAPKKGRSSDFRYYTSEDTLGSDEKRKPESNNDATVRSSNWPIPHSYTEGGGRNRRGAKQNSAKDKMFRASKKYLTAKTDADKQAAQQEMTEGLSMYFDNDMKFREQDIAKIETRLKNLRTQLEKRRAAKAKLVELQVQLLINEANGLGFYGQPGSQSSRGSWYSSIAAPWAYGMPQMPRVPQVPQITAPQQNPQVDGPGPGVLQPTDPTQVGR